MIRPFTLVCMLMAGGSGLYLYQSKHEAQLLDRRIGETIKQTEQAREQIKLLEADWNMLTKSDRLSDLAKAHLALRSIDPTRWRTVDEIGHLLPAAVVIQKPVEPEPEPMPAIALAAPPAATAVPVRPLAVAVAMPQAAEPKVADGKPADSKQAAADAKQIATRQPSHPHGNQAATVAAATPVVPMQRPALSAPIVPIATMTASGSAATAPGTVGEAVARAMRANMAATAAPQQIHYAAPVMAAPTYPAPVYAAPAYAPPYGSPQPTSLLGSSRGSLPPPVPFAAR